MGRRIGAENKVSVKEKTVEWKAQKRNKGVLPSLGTPNGVSARRGPFVGGETKGVDSRPGVSNCTAPGESGQSKHSSG